MSAFDYLTVIVPDSQIGLNGHFYQIDLPSLAGLDWEGEWSGVHAVQWVSAKGAGEIEFHNAALNIQISSVDDINGFDALIAAWELAHKRNNPPNSYSWFDEESGEWTEDETLKEVFEAQQRKAVMQQQLDELTVEVDDMVFDANEKSITRMTAAIQSAEVLSKTEAEWKLADNSWQTVTLAQLKTALAQGILRVGEVLKAAEEIE